MQGGLNYEWHEEASLYHSVLLNCRKTTECCSNYSSIPVCWDTLTECHSIYTMSLQSSFCQITHTANIFILTIHLALQFCPNVQERRSLWDRGHVPPIFMKWCRLFYPATTVVCYILMQISLLCVVSQKASPGPRWGTTVPRIRVFFYVPPIIPWDRPRPILSRVIAVATD